MTLIELFGLDADVFLAGLALFPVPSHPCFVAFTGGGIAAREGERSDIGIRNAHLLVRIRGIDTDQRVVKGFAGTAIENIAGELFAVL